MHPFKKNIGKGTNDKINMKVRQEKKKKPMLNAEVVRR